MVATVGALFQLARFSEAFLILRAQNIGLVVAWTPLVLIVMNLSYTLTSYPLGHLSDLIKREWLLLAGMVVLAIADLTLAFAATLWTVLFGTILWGLHLGLTQGTLAAMVADTCPKDRRGTAFGIFNLLSALALLLASFTAGSVWDHLGPKATFLIAAGFCSIGIAAMLLRALVKIGRTLPPKHH
jgi:MFS family permease